MTINKKVRFEVFKRDGFKCAYCGKSPPVVTLEIDHIEPKSRKGLDNINNLITACFDCNRGKTNIPLNKAPNTLSQNLEILKEQEAQLMEYRRFTKKVEDRIRKDIKDISKIYSDAYPEWALSEIFQQVSLRRFLELLPKEKVIDAMRYSISKWPYDKNRVIRYFCGICWHKIRGDYES